MGPRVTGIVWRLRASRRIWRRGAPVELQLPGDEQQLAEAAGALDWPSAGTVLPRGVVTIRGWMLFPAEHTASVELHLGDRSLGRARLGLQRDDVAAETGNSLGVASGFELTVNLADWPKGETLLRARATGTSGAGFDFPGVEMTIAGGPAPRAPARVGSSNGHRATARCGIRTLVCTHQLDLGGAQLLLADLLAGLLELDAIDPTVVSATDGPVRGRLEDLGIPVHITSPVPIDEPRSHAGRVEELSAWASGRDFELALINTSTASALLGAEAAALLGLPTVWFIHESFELDVIWGGFHEQVRRRADAVLSNTAAAIFVADSTRALYEPLIPADRCMTIPQGLDLESIEAQRAGFDRVGERRSAGIPEDADAIVCVGTIEPRKAQVPLALAFDLIAERHPQARLFLVGGREDRYTHFLERAVESLGSAERIDLVPMTTDAQRWIGLSDLLVCASDVESLPRAVLEAMAWGVPVLATRVFGLPELIDDGETGWLCDDRDVGALAAGLDRALGAAAEERRRVAGAARELVLSENDAGPFAGAVAEILSRVAAESGSPVRA